MLGCDPGDHGFESHRSPQLQEKSQSLDKSPGALPRDRGIGQIDNMSGSSITAIISGFHPEDLSSILSYRSKYSRVAQW